MLGMLIFAAAAGAQPALAQTSAATLGAPCHMRGIETVAPKAKDAVRAQNLNELPNANAYLTVLRTDENGCNKPLIVVYDIGSAPRKPR